MSLTDNKLIAFFLDKKVKISSKLAYAIIILFILISINDLISFTHYQRLNNKIETIAKLKELKKESTDSLIINFSNSKIEETIAKKGVIETIYESLSNNLNQKYNNQIHISTTGKSENTQSYFWFFFSSGGIYYFLAFLIFPSMLLSKGKDSLSQKIGQAIIATFVILSFGGLFSLICSFIPEIIDGKYWVNYLINGIVQILPMIITTKIASRKKMITKNIKHS